MTLSLTCGVALLYKTEKNILRTDFEEQTYDISGPNWGKNDYASFSKLKKVPLCKISKKILELNIEKNNSYLQTNILKLNRN